MFLYDLRIFRTNLSQYPLRQTYCFLTKARLGRDSGRRQGTNNFSLLKKKISLYRIKNILYNIYTYLIDEQHPIVVIKFSFQGVNLEDILSKYGLNHAPIRFRL